MTKEERKLYMKTWYENHKGYMKMHMKKYYKEHREEYIANQKSYRKNNKDYVNKAQNDRHNRTAFAEKHNNKWTSEEILYLKTNAQSKIAYEIALELGRSEQSVTHKACRLGISLNKYN